MSTSKGADEKPLAQLRAEAKAPPPATQRQLVRDERITAPIIEQAKMGAWFRPRADWSATKRKYYYWRAGRRLLMRVANRLIDAGECPDYFPQLFAQIEIEISIWGARLEGKELWPSHPPE